MTNNYTPSDAAIIAGRFAARTEGLTSDSGTSEVGEIAVRAAATQIAIDVLRDIRTTVLENTDAAALFSLDDRLLSHYARAVRDAYEVVLRTIELRARELGAEVR
jgi:hypothetical protein